MLSTNFFLFFFYVRDVSLAKIKPFDFSADPYHGADREIFDGIFLSPRDRGNCKNSRDQLPFNGRLRSSSVSSNLCQRLAAVFTLPVRLFAWDNSKRSERILVNF